ncbi:hypothetical protein AUC68_00975 [Methyloceanibacter methanicus]|uniref:Uncharacterized protein n=2 Tax=Methyloceanibacter methanicus TaxID=1774968 RepID=A0A1E3W3M5_9HYPH|nr:hypothetical protein [Methyloceanibacter methanicus]ODS00374.1 hypothetical protein AUC68_00975 [Methyloceanibacter methanicus]
MTTAVDPENTPLEDRRIEGTVFTPRQVRLLKIAVVVMGLLLLAGLAAVIAGMIFQASKVGKKAPPPAPAVSAPVLSGALSALTIPEAGRSPCWRSTATVWQFTCDGRTAARSPLWTSRPARSSPASRSRGRQRNKP